MNKQPPEERRRHLRHAFTTEFKGTRFSLVDVKDASSEMFHGWVQDFGEGGLHLIADRELNLFDVVRGVIMLPDFPMGIPSPLQVRWVKRATNRRKYHIGFQFLA